MSELVEVKTIGEVEHIVHDSGWWDGTGPVEFSNDGIEWTAAWVQTDEHPHPLYARVSVYRKEVRIPTEVTVRWDEQYPEASEKWSAMWDRSPMRHFGRIVRMIGYRQTFRDLLSNIVLEDEVDDRAGLDAAPVDEPPARDWEAEIAAAETVEQIDEIDAEGRRLRIFTPDAAGTALHRALKARRKAIVAAAAAAWSAPAIAASGVVPGVAATVPDSAIVSLDELVNRFDEETPLSRALLEEIAQDFRSDPEGYAVAIDTYIETGSRLSGEDLERLQAPVPGIRRPQDHKPPMNRAARRKAARRKGRR